MDPEDSERDGGDNSQPYLDTFYFSEFQRKRWLLSPQLTPKSALASASADVNIVIQDS